MLIYKIFRESEWAAFQETGETGGSLDDVADGFVHFSTAAQVPGTLARHFAGDRDLMLLACDADRLGDDLWWEPSRDGALFPHLFRALRRDDILWTRRLPWGPNGHQPGELP